MAAPFEVRNVNYVMFMYIEYSEETDINFCVIGYCVQCLWYQDINAARQTGSCICVIGVLREVLVTPGSYIHTCKIYDFNRYMYLGVRNFYK